MSEDVKHTPGPRIVERCDDDDGHIYYAVHGKDYEFIGNFDNKADALLDAAAPELLSALKLADSYIRNLDGGDPRTETGWKSDELLEVWLKVRAAISRAESPSPMREGEARAIAERGEE